jgi:hypothetical protein
MATVDLPAPFVVAGSVLEFAWPLTLDLQVTAVSGGSLEKNGSSTSLPATFTQGDMIRCDPAGGVMVLTATIQDFPLSADGLTADALATLISEDSGVTASVVSDLLVLTPAAIPWDTLTHATTANKGLRTNGSGGWELYDLAPVGLYDGGGFLLAPVGLNEDQPDSGTWNLTSDQFTTTDQDVDTTINVAPPAGYRSYQTSQQARTEWFLNFSLPRVLRLQEIGVYFGWTGSLKEATFELSIIDGDDDTVIASVSRVCDASGSVRSAEKVFTFATMVDLPVNMVLKLERLSGDVEVCPTWNQTTPTSVYDIATDWVARDDAGAPITTTAYPAGLQMDLKLRNIHDPVEAETATVSSTGTQYDVSGMHLTRLDVATSDLPDTGTSQQYWDLELTVLAAAHGDLLEGISLGVQYSRGDPDQLQGQRWTQNRRWSHPGHRHQVPF